MSLYKKNLRRKKHCEQLSKPKQKQVTMKSDWAGYYHNKIKQRINKSIRGNNI